MDDDNFSPYIGDEHQFDPPETHWFWDLGEKVRLPYIIGYSFDRIARHLLKKSSISLEYWLDNRNTNPDIEDHNLRCHFEIKGSSNMNTLIISEDQFDSLLKMLGFPINDQATWIFSYINRENRHGKNKRERLLKNHKSQNEIFEFLTKQTNMVYVIHHTFLDGIRRKKGTANHHDLRNNKDTDIISIKRTDLKLAIKDTRGSLFNLNLSDEISRWLPPGAKSIPTRMVETVIDGHPVKFKFFILLPNSLKVRLLRHLNGVVKKTLD
ncbi:MAG: hypothetical protein A3G46_02705 [Candidatus Zambryskibacteria bacterium RIFCSPLOWO2_12_FULL_39_16]|uniref:Uncharacterized protein n=1 Tax=Candidatus Zambryskibacteria bacterium RIFCSPLOWO2_12_FULL_39_16 TaxID=1802775 RepID=A0A1G2UUG7_9BACT|nr:MAG: hypothetical protein A3I19_00005 [Candidatus Zambryskibacteria bacterium RIFCSPLOWO2_02_FULL_38_13]OHB12902.1 MAG: hypothetical protein A3G46_02705 [Candidatus Zambryskibacteria bacterium RIFCSPLOWO2_12_FULL_39_16]